MEQIKTTMGAQFIKLYKNVLPPELCSHMINTYERLRREQEEQIKKLSLCHDEYGEKLCGACNCQRLDICSIVNLRNLLIKLFVDLNM